MWDVWYVLKRQRHQNQPAISLSPRLSCYCPRIPLPSSSTTASPRHLPSIVCDGEHPLRRSGDLRFPTPDACFRQCLALRMAKHNPSTIPPPSIRFLRNLSAIPRPPTPSSALLTILAGLVGSVNPSPVACHDSNAPPPSFLCPSLELHPEVDVQGFILPPHTPPPSSPVPGPSRTIPTEVPTPPVKRRARRNLAPGYAQGDDGRWRKLSTWSLYGSTVCMVRAILIS